MSVMLRVKMMYRCLIVSEKLLVKVNCRSGPGVGVTVGVAVGVSGVRVGVDVHTPQGLAVDVGVGHGRPPQHGTPPQFGVGHGEPIWLPSVVQSTQFGTFTVQPGAGVAAGV